MTFNYMTVVRLFLTFFRGSSTNEMYCTISIDSAWGVTCDQMDEISATSNAGVTLDTVLNSAGHGILKGKQMENGVVMLEKKAK